MNLLPMKAMQYFCVAARTLSFKDAAQQLSVTPGAVSQQIKALELWLGFQLFERETRALRLTPAGNTYYKRVTPHIQELLGISHSMRHGSATRPLYIALPPSFEVVCFAPRLKRLMELFPKLELRTKTSQLPVTLKDDGTEIAIRYLPTPDPELNCTKLASLHLQPLCSPEFLQQNPQILTGSFEGVTLIHNILHPDWHLFYLPLGINPATVRNFHCEQSLTAIDVARAGGGITLVDNVMGHAFIESGQLVRFCDYNVKASRDLYLVHSKHTHLSRQVCEVKEWLIESFSEATPSDIPDA